MSAASTAKISTILPDGKQKLYFMKTATGKEAETMFRGMPYFTTPTREQAKTK